MKIIKKQTILVYCDREQFIIYVKRMIPLKNCIYIKSRYSFISSLSLYPEPILSSILYLL